MIRALWLLTVRGEGTPVVSTRKMSRPSARLTPLCLQLSEELRAPWS